MGRIHIAHFFSNQARWGSWEWAFWLLWIVLFFAASLILAARTAIELAARRRGLPSAD